MKCGLWLEHKDRPLVLCKGGSGGKLLEFLMRWSLDQSDLWSHHSTCPSGSIPYPPSRTLLLQWISLASSSPPLHGLVLYKYSVTSLLSKNCLQLVFSPTATSFFFPPCKAKRVQRLSILVVSNSFPLRLSWTHLIRLFLPLPTDRAPIKVAVG